MSFETIRSAGRRADRRALSAIRPRVHTLLTALLVALLFAFAFSSCSSTSSDVKSKSDSQWLEPSPALREQIEDRAKRLPWTHGLERIELIQWFASVGEPAYGTLLELVHDPRCDVAGAALAALGATRDSRLVEPLRALPIETDPNNAESVAFSLEHARTLLRLGDWSRVPDLIAGLRDERAVTRTLSFHALFEATRERFDYDPRAEADAREASVKRWEGWWQSRQKDPLLLGRSSTRDVKKPTSTDPARSELP